MKKVLPIIALLLVASAASSRAENGTSLIPTFRQEVDRRLDLPEKDQLRYAQLLESALGSAGTPFTKSQYILVLDRNPNVQAIILYWLDLQESPPRFHYIGASPASTGTPGQVGYFITPLGVFTHTLDNKDFRAEGTPNRRGILGYGRKGMRIFDFGWVQGERGWGNGGLSQMRLLLHATDPDQFERYLGIPRSKGCIRIPATLDTFLDRYGLLDADYEQELAKGKKLWVLSPNRTATPWSGRYLVIVDSGSMERPLWSPEPDAR